MVIKCIFGLIKIIMFVCMDDSENEISIIKYSTPESGWWWAPLSRKHWNCLIWLSDVLLFVFLFLMIMFWPNCLGKPLRPIRYTNYAVMVSPSINPSLGLGGGGAPSPSPSRREHRIIEVNLRTCTLIGRYNLKKMNGLTNRRATSSNKRTL